MSRATPADESHCLRRRFHEVKQIGLPGRKHWDGCLVELSLDKAETYAAEVKKLTRKKKISLACFHKIVGNLIFAALCLSAGQTLMMPLHMALRGTLRDTGCGKNPEVHESLDDWLQLIKDLGSRPTGVHKIVFMALNYYDYCDACKTGAGGVWLPLELDLDPFVWTVKWLTDIVRKLAEYDDISISDVCVSC